MNDMIQHAPGTSGGAFAGLMRFIVPEDRGRIQAENTAVYTVAAAGLHLSGLTQSAKDFIGRHPGAVTEALLGLSHVKQRAAARKLKHDLQVPDGLITVWTSAQVRACAV